MTLVPVPTKTARSHSDISKGDVPLTYLQCSIHLLSIVMAWGQAENPNHNDFISTRLPQSGIHFISLTWQRAEPRTFTA